MFRRWMSRWMRAHLEPHVAWSELETLQTLATISIQIPRLWSRAENVDQVLCESGHQYVLFKRWASGRLERICFARQLNSREMRLAETHPVPNPVYRLALCPLDSDSVSYLVSRQIWFRLWRNEPLMKLGAGICFIDSHDRDLLKELRLKLLDGKIPAPLQAEEAMWERINSMSEVDRRAAYATLAMQQFGELNRQFQETHGDLGPVPDELKPIFDQIQRQKQKIEEVAAAHPVDPETTELMQQFTDEIAVRARSAAGRDRPT